MIKGQEITTQITLSEVLHAATWGCYRNIQSWKNAKDKYGAQTEKDDWQINIMSCIGERAWAKYKNIYYNAEIGNYGAADVGNYYQIRASSIVNRHNAELRLHAKDEDEKPYILTLVGMEQVIFVGWLFAYEGKLTKYWGDRWGVRRPAYFVPQKDLHPMSTIPEIPDSHLYSLDSRDPEKRRRETWGAGSVEEESPAMSQGIPEG